MESVGMLAVAGLIACILVSVHSAAHWLLQAFLLLESQDNVGLRDWLEVAGRAGLPIAFLLAVVWFLYQKFWPFVTKQIETAQQNVQTARTEEANKITAALEKMGQIQLETNRAMIEEMRMMRLEINGRKSNR